MSDERDPRSRPDETRPLPPYGDGGDAAGVERPAGANHPDDGPQSGDAWVFDRTEQQPGVPGGDATVADPRPPRRDATSIMPPVRDAWSANQGAANQGEAPWAGRAEVRPPRPSDYGDTDWTTAATPSEPRGKWWMPIVVGIVGLILVALLGWGIWLIIQAQDKDSTPTPAPVPSAAPATTLPTTQPTTAPPTTKPTTTDPTKTSVKIPALRGLSQQAAIQALSSQGLSSRLRFVTSNDATAGTVIDSDPEEGQEVPPDTTVTLIIAASPTTAPTAPSGGVINQPGN
jgi:PASTA domain